MDNTLGLEAQIRDTYARLAADNLDGRRLGRFVTLDELRAALPADIPRETVDAALSRLADHSDVHVMPRSDQRNATLEDRAAALWMGGQHNHWMTIDPTRDAERVVERLRMRDRDHATSMVGALDDREVESVAPEMGVDVVPGEPEVTRQRVIDRSVANHDAWLAKANQEVADGTLLYRADNDPEWVAGWSDEDREAVRAAAERQSQMDWQIGRERGARWAERLADSEAPGQPAPPTDQTARTADPHEQGVADGYAGGPYNEDLFTDEQHGPAYRAGLQEGRTAAVDEELIAAYGPEPADQRRDDLAEAEDVEADEFEDLDSHGEDVAYVEATRGPEAAEAYAAFPGECGRNAARRMQQTAEAGATSCAAADDDADGM